MSSLKSGNSSMSRMMDGRFNASDDHFAFSISAYSKQTAGAIQMPDPQPSLNGSKAANQDPTCTR
jgi:hypothetical protein